LPKRATKRCVRSGPIAAAMPYRIQAPTTDPIVAATIIPQNVDFPSLAWNPANGSTISDGIGGNRFSRATSNATPTYPILSMTSTTQSAKLLNTARRLLQQRPDRSGALEAEVARHRLDPDVDLAERRVRGAR